MSFLSGIGDLLKQYSANNATSGAAPAVEQHFDQVAQAVPSSTLAGGLAEAFRSSQTAPFPQMARAAVRQREHTATGGHLEWPDSHAWAGSDCQIRRRRSQLSAGGAAAVRFRYAGAGGQRQPCRGPGSYRPRSESGPVNHRPCKRNLCRASNAYQKYGRGGIDHLP